MIQELIDKLEEARGIIVEIGFDREDFDMEMLDQELFNAIVELDELDIKDINNL